MKPGNAAVAAGYSENYARAKAYKIERLVKVGMADAFERAGLTDKAIVSHAIEGLNANKVISCNVIAPNGEGMKEANSMTKDFVDVPDWQARHKYFETILKLTDKLRENATPLIDQSAHFHFTKVNDETLIDEARKRGLALPNEIARRVGTAGLSKQD